MGCSVVKVYVAPVGESIGPTSELGQKRAKAAGGRMSGVTPEADIDRRFPHGRFVPEADISGHHAQDPPHCLNPWRGHGGQPMPPLCLLARPGQPFGLGLAFRAFYRSRANKGPRVL